MDRRTLLVQTAAAATSLFLPRSAVSRPRWSDNPFALGVASGSPTHHSVVLWTRLLQNDVLGISRLGSKPIAVQWEIAHDVAFARVVHKGQSMALPELGYSVHVEVQGLKPDYWYYYRFMVGDAVSTVGRTRTFPQPHANVRKLRLAYASCQRWEHGYYSAWRHMCDEQLDMVLFLGDYIYEYPGATNAVRPVTGGWVTTLDDYRARYALYKSDPNLQAMHAQCPWLMTWDDHEVQNDYAGTHPGDSGVPDVDFLARRAAAYQAYYENMPLPAGVLTQALAGLVRGAEMRIYGRIPFGKLVTIHMLDDRQYRDPQICASGLKLGAGTVKPQNCPDWGDPRRTLLGAAQERWLDNGFASTQGQWNVLGQQTVLGQRDFKLGEGQLFSNDGWDGYSAARTRLIGGLQRHDVPNPVVLGGDVHANWVGHVKADYNNPQSTSVGVEFCGTSITSRRGNNEKMAERLAENPHFIFADDQRRGYGVAEFTPQQLTTTLRVVHDAEQPDSGIETLAQFVVPAGQSRIELA
jgi:alkaline phosphatase D